MDDARLHKIENIAEFGATEGERQAAKNAYERATGKRYITQDERLSLFANAAIDTARALGKFKFHIK